VFISSREFVRGSAGSVAESGLSLVSYTGGSGTLLFQLRENHACVVSKSMQLVVNASVLDV